MIKRWMMLNVLAGAFILNFGLSATGFSEPTQRTVVDSPKGKYRITITVLEHKRFTEKETNQSLDNIHHVRYRLAFQRNENSDTSSPIQTEWVDVYGFTSSPPVKPEVFFNWFLWSPEEEFVILPGEGWASAPGSPYRKAVALNPELPWKEETFHMDGNQLLWSNSRHVIGNVQDDCHYEVVLFDGGTGKTRSLWPAKAPVGFQIQSKSGRMLQIEKMLDNCASEKDRRSFVPQCWKLNLEDLKSTVVACK